MLRWIFFGSTLLLLGLLHTACRNDLEEVNAVIKPEDIQQEIIHDFETLYSDSAKLRVRLRGPVLIRHLDKQEPRQEFPEGVFVEFFSPNKRVTSRLTARYAIRYEDEGKVVVRDSVVWESVDRERLESEELIWDEQAEKVYTNKFVTIYRPDEIVWGYGFEADQEFTRSRVKAAEGRIKVDKLKDVR